tara:strand:- start:391 stop:753 length:363 start_codon:yes stop_codon:yes gene_type:complete
MDPSFLEIEIELPEKLRHLGGIDYVYITISRSHLREWAEANLDWQECTRALTEGYVSFRVLEALELCIEDIEIYLQLSRMVKPDSLDLRDMLSTFLLDLRAAVVDSLRRVSIEQDLITLH